MNKRAVCIISGGMDSALSAKIAEKEGYEIVALHFNYGQRTEHKEVECFRKIAASVNASESYEIDYNNQVREGNLNGRETTSLSKKITHFFPLN